MSRRKILLLAFSLSAVAIGFGFFGPRFVEPSHVDAAEAFALLELRDDEECADGMKLDIPEEIAVELRVVEANVFSDNAKEGRRTRGAVKDAIRLLSTFMSDPGAHLVQWPSYRFLNGQRGKIGATFWGRPISEDGDSPIARRFGLEADVKVVLRKDGRLHVQVDVVDATYSGSPPKPNCALLHANGSFVLKDQETGFLGGIKTKRIRTEPYAVPMLSALPGVGSWFQFPREVEVEQELLILVTVSRKGMP